MTAAGTALWRQGAWRIRVTSALGGVWEYDVIGTGDRPSHGWLAGTPWALYPGAEWDEGAEGCWTVPVFWQSGGAPESDGGLTGG